MSRWMKPSLGGSKGCTVQARHVASCRKGSGLCTTCKPSINCLALENTHRLNLKCRARSFRELPGDAFHRLFGQNALLAQQISCSHALQQPLFIARRGTAEPCSQSSSKRYTSESRSHSNERKPQRRASQAPGKVALLSVLQQSQNVGLLQPVATCMPRFVHMGRFGAPAGLCRGWRHAWLESPNRSGTLRCLSRS